MKQQWQLSLVIAIEHTGFLWETLPVAIPTPYHTLKGVVVS